MRPYGSAARSLGAGTSVSSRSSSTAASFAGTYHGSERSRAVSWKRRTTRRRGGSPASIACSVVEPTPIERIEEIRPPTTSRTQPSTVSGGCGDAIYRSAAGGGGDERVIARTPEPWTRMGTPSSPSILRRLLLDTARSPDPASVFAPHPTTRGSMANSDRISEVYKGEIWATSTQRVARDRIHWLVTQATGDVLDVGCSQGIASILCARRGLAVVGIDIQADRVDYALAERENEPEDVRARLDFRLADGGALDFPDASFDTVLMGEIVEHSEDASPLLAEAARVLRPQGLLVLTTPFGLSRHHDHHATFYVDSLVRLLAPHFTVESLDIVDRYLRARGRPGAMADPDRLVVESQPLMEARAGRHPGLDGGREGEDAALRRRDRAVRAGQRADEEPRGTPRPPVLPYGLRDLAAQVGQEPQVVAPRRGAVERQAPGARRCGCPRRSPPR